MLKTRLTDNDISISSYINSQDYSSDRDHYNNKLLNLGTLSVINSITDTEVYEYKPELINEINFNVFFLRYMQDTTISEITPYLESNFTDHVKKTKIALGVIDSNSEKLQRAFNNVFEVRQADTELREPILLSETNKTRLSALLDRPYVSADIIGELSLKNPNETGLPIFYNSYTIPFWDKKNDWMGEKLLYKNKPYYNNSFLLIEFYDSPSPLDQNRIISIPIFVNSRYNIKELTNNGDNSILLERPSFKLKEGMDGFSFFFLGNYIRNDFYAKFSFWDAANGKKIPLLPSGNQEANKKWFQNTNNFKQNDNYLKYVLDYGNKTYKIFEHNSTTNEYDLERNTFDLYELSFDQYYEKVFVSNETPFDARSLKPKEKPKIPLKFGIRNLYREVYLGDNVSKQSTLQYNVKRTYLYSSLSYGIRNYGGVHTGRLLDKLNAYVVNTKKLTINNLPKTNYTYPKITNFNEPITINGFVRRLQTFFANNIDTDTWRIRKMGLENINIILDDTKVFGKTFYLETSSNWDVKDKTKMCESMTLMINQEFKSSYYGDIIYDFIPEIMYSVDFIPQFIDIVNQAIDKNIIFNRINNLHILTDLLNPILAGINYNFKHNRDYIRNFKNELKPQSWFIISQYSKLTDNDQQIIKKKVIDGLANISPVYDEAFQEILSSIIKKIVNNFNPAEAPNLVKKYIELSEINSISFGEIEDIIKLSVEQGGFNYLITDLNNNPKLREYMFNLIVRHNGDQFITKDEKLLFTFDVVIGNKMIPVISASSKITIVGKLKISIINQKSDIKNIFIPINVNMRIGKEPRLTRSTITTQLGGSDVIALNFGG